MALVEDPGLVEDSSQELRPLLAWAGVPDDMSPQPCPFWWEATMRKWQFLMHLRCAGFDEETLNQKEGAVI